MTPRLLPLAALAALALAGCGKMGDLERPGPLFGGPKAEAGKAAPTPPAPVSTVDRRDRDTSTDLAPIRDAQVPGSAQNPQSGGAVSNHPDPNAGR
jgi:hypothetical protein